MKTFGILINFSHYKLLGGYLYPFSFQTSSTNFENQKIQRLCRHVNNVFTCRLSILSRFMSNPPFSFVACLFSVAFCHGAKILKDQFVTYRNDFGKDFSNKGFSSSAGFSSLNFLLRSIFNQPSSTIDCNQDRTEGKKTCF